MKLRVMLLASLFMAMFAFLPLSASAAPARAIISETTGLQANSNLTFARGTATYKEYAGGGRSFQVTVTGIKTLRGQQLIVKVFDINDNYVPVCTIRVNAFGGGSCYVATRLGEIVPVITTSTDGSGSYIYVETTPQYGGYDFLQGEF